VLRRGLGLRSRGLGSLRRWRRELRRGKALRLSRGLGLRLRLGMGAARRKGLSLRQRLSLRWCLGRGLRHGLGTGVRLGLRGSLSRGLLCAGRLGLPRILGLRGQSVCDGRRLGGNLRLCDWPGLRLSLGLRSDLVR